MTAFELYEAYRKFCFDNLVFALSYEKFVAALGFDDTKTK